MSVTMPIRTTVLIVGAGPSGLTAALSLIHHGFKDFVVVDAVEQGENTSRALVIHAATLEVGTPSVPLFLTDIHPFQSGVGHYRVRRTDRCKGNKSQDDQHRQPFDTARLC